MAESDQAGSSEQVLGRRQRKALAVRRQLLAAGLACFDRRPIAMVSVLDITEAADVAKGVFYLHFKSKDEFLIALWRDVQAVLRDLLGTDLAGVRSVRTRVQRALVCYRRFAGESTAAARFWNRMTGYLADEIGQPGQLTQVRFAWLDELAALLAGGGDPSPAVRRVAAMTDAFSWGLISQAIQLGTDLPGDDLLLRAGTRLVQTDLS